MYMEDEYIQLSALQHFLFCPRQCALAYVEFVWEENALTMQGHMLHDKVHNEENETRGDTLVCRGVRLSSSMLGLSGQADVVEFHRCSENEGAVILGKKGFWKPFPVEYKRGKQKRDNCDAVQLCAQAMCLEEMLGIDINVGALFYGSVRKRVGVEFSDALRCETEKTALKLHKMINEGITPKPEFNKKCKQCSLIDKCMPAVFSKKKSRSYLNKIFEEEE